MKNTSDEQLRILEKQNIECCDVRKVMCDYADGELCQSLKDRIDDHITYREECEEFKESYMMTIQMAKELKPAPLDLDQKNRLRKALNERLGINLSMVQA